MAYAKPIPAYEESVGRRREFMKAGFKAPGDPEKASAAILELAAMRQMPLRQPLGTDATVILKFGYEQALGQLARTSPHYGLRGRRSCDNSWHPRDPHEGAVSVS